MFPNMSSFSQLFRQKLPSFFDCQAALSKSLSSSTTRLPDMISSFHIDSKSPDESSLRQVLDIAFDL